MRYPYERFLRFLVSRGADVNQTIKRYGLPPVGGLWPSQYRSKIRKEAPASVVRYIDSDDGTLAFRDGFLEWADREGFGDLWRFQAEFDGGPPPPDVDLAFRVFINPTGRYTVGVLLFSSADDEKVIEGVKERLDLTLTSAAIQTYKRLFWDISLVRRQDWSHLLRQMSPEERNYLSAALNGDKSKSVRRTIGVADRKSPEEILEDIANRAYNHFVKASERPNPESANARYWAELAVKSSSSLLNRKGRFGQDEVKPVTADALESMFSVEVTSSNHVTLEELQGQFVKPDKSGGK